jgi:hypothetical protein
MNNINVNPKTFPIALVLAGTVLCVVAAYGYYFGQNPNSTLTLFLVVIGVALILLAIPINQWEKEMYDRDKERYKCRTIFPDAFKQLVHYVMK